MYAGPAVVEEIVADVGENCPFVTVNVEGLTVPRLVERFTVPV
jgi:hypothetical protein